MSGALENNDQAKEVVNENDEAKDVGQNNDDQKVSPDGHKRAIDDMMKYKKAAKGALEELANLRKELAQRDEEAQKGKNNYKELYENLSKKHQEVEEEKTNLLRSLELTAKYDAIKDIALKSGLRSEAIHDLDNLDFEGVEVEHTTKGRRAVLGADLFVENLKKNRPHWFESKKQVPGFNAGGTQGSGATGKLTAQDVIDAEMKASRTKKPEDHKAYLKIREDFIKSRK